MKGGAKLFLLHLVSLGLALDWTQKASAISYDPLSVVPLTDQSTVDVLVKTIAIGTDHREYRSASTIKLGYGFDFGVDVMMFQPSSLFRDTLGGITFQSVPALVPIGRLNFQKSLPYRFDLGFSYFQYSDASVQVRLTGGNLKWGLNKPEGNKTSFAVKVSANDANMGFIQSRVYKIDLVASQPIFIFDPYVGVGIQSWAGSLNIPPGMREYVASGLVLSSSGTAAHYYIGTVVRFIFSSASASGSGGGGGGSKVVFGRIASEADFSTVGIANYGLKLSIGF